MSPVWDRRMSLCFPRVLDRRKSMKTQVLLALEFYWHPVRLLFFELYFGEHWASSLAVGSVCPGVASCPDFLKLGVMPLSTIGISDEICHTMDRIWYTVRHPVRFLSCLLFCASCLASPPVYILLSLHLARPPAPGRVHYSTHTPSCSRS